MPLYIFTVSKARHDALNRVELIKRRRCEKLVFVGLQRNMFGIMIEVNQDTVGEIIVACMRFQ